MENEITLKYQLSQAELLGAIRAQSTRAWSFRFLGVFILGMIAYALVQQLVYGATLDWLVFTLAPVLIVAAALGVFTFYNPLMRRRIRQHPQFVSAQDWKFSDEGVDWQTIAGKSQREWQAYPRFSEDPNFFFLFLKSNAFVPIPKRAFASADEQARFRELLKRKTM